jgi:hypothetical protein
LVEADNKEGCVETLGDADGEVEGPEMAQTRDPKKAHCSIQACSKVTKRAVPKDQMAQTKRSKARR